MRFKMFKEALQYVSKKELFAFFFLLVSLPVSLYLLGQRQELRKEASLGPSTGILGSVAVHFTCAGFNQDVLELTKGDICYASALALDSADQPIFEPGIVYEWGISSDTGIGRLETTQGLVSAFYADRDGFGTIWVLAKQGSREARKGTLVQVGPLINPPVASPVEKPTPSPSAVPGVPSPAPQPGRGDRTCAQVVTHAQNPQTGECKNFPTPCGVPEGWETVITCVGKGGNAYLVKPYLVYPADKPMYPEYEKAVKNYLRELQRWYMLKVGVTFDMTPLNVVRSKENYLTMRCGPNPSQECVNDPKKLEGNWGKYMNEAIHEGVEKWEEKTVALIFSAGGGGFAGANRYANDTGFGITGDWVLEPISGKENEWGIPCKYSSGWECKGGVPKGSPAHELGHAFGLPHPDGYEGKSIMKWHGDYPEVGFLPHEIERLRQSPFMKLRPFTGDMDADGTVGIFDYNQLIEKFGKKNPDDLGGADLDFDGDVDIFDYNFLIENFGKKTLEID